VHPRLSLHTIGFGADVTAAELTAFARESGAPSIGCLASGAVPEEPDVTIAHLTTAGWFTLDRPERWDEERAALVAIIDHAARVGAELVYGVTGPAGSLTWEAAIEALGEAVAPVLEHSRAIGVPLLVETTNVLRQDINVITTLRDLVTVAEQTGLAICADLFWCWREPGLDATIARLAPHTKLVQVSDYVPGIVSMPDRRVPGDGIVPFERLLAPFLEHGYAGRFDVELVGPAITAEGPARAIVRGAEHIGGILDRLGA